MRRPILSELLLRDPKVRFVIPDTALVEMTKNEHWETTLRKSFELLWPVANRCFMSISIQEALQKELQTRRSIDGDLLPSQFRKMIRDIINGSQSERSNSTISLIKRQIVVVQHEIMANDLNEELLRAELTSSVNSLRKGMSREDLKACRHPDTGRARRLLIAKFIGDGFYEQYMKDKGVPSSVIRRLKRQKCMTLRWAYLRAHHALNWLSDDGLAHARNKTLVNDILDQDYVLTASFFTGIVSLETDVNDSLADLNFMLYLNSIQRSD